jgi:tetratricopeptide (TPR) repeat protein
MLSLILVSAPVWTTGWAQSSQDEERSKTDPRLSQGQIAPLLNGMGEHTHPVTTGSDRVQRFFDQGLNLTLGFNHAEAIRAFQEAARLDPNCAMAYWGMALAYGPNINSRMGPENARKAYEAIQKAVSLKSLVSQQERDYIDALARRYSDDQNVDQRERDKAYASAMANLSKKYPDDLDAATLHAASIMNINPWPGHEYWNKDGTAREGTTEFVAILESVMARDTKHPGANHYYIHAVEASPAPELAVPSADRLEELMPGAGHMVHMPSHIYIRVGRYADASASNLRAIEADEDYIEQCNAQGIYPLGYYPHNIHFLWASATLEGRSRVAIDSARKVAAKVLKKDRGVTLRFLAPEFYALVHFGKWREIVAYPQPTGNLALTGIWHYARGMALRAEGKLDEASRELDSLIRIGNDGAIEKLRGQANPASAILPIARHILAGEIAAKRGNFATAISHLDTAVRFEDGLVYTEPADWNSPARHYLGAVLLEAGRTFEAEVVYWEDLKRNPENGRSLFGLMLSLQAQGKNALAEDIERRFQNAWFQADIKLESSRF